MVPLALLILQLTPFAQVRMLGPARLLGPTITLTGVTGGTATYDNSIHFECDGGQVGPTCGSSTAAVSFTVGANTNRALAATVCVSNTGATAAHTVTAFTYAGVSLTLVRTRSGAGNTSAVFYCSLYQLPSGTQPTTGANTLSVTLTGIGFGESILLGGYSAFDVDQTNNLVVGGDAGNDGSSTSATLTLGTNSANDLPFFSVCNGTSVSATTTGTSRWAVNYSTHNSCGATGGATTAGATTSLTRTVGSDSWIAIGAPFKAGP